MRCDRMPNPVVSVEEGVLAPCTTYEDRRLARGYLLSKDDRVTPHDGWLSRRVGSWQLWHDPRLTFASASTGTAWVAVLGFLVDTATWEDDHAVVLKDAAAALDRAEEELLARSDLWSGRFLLVYGRNGRTRLATDATGMRSAFYNLEGPLAVSSHASLVYGDRTPRAKDHSFVHHPNFSRSVGSFPGRLTPWKDVVFLTANTVLDLETRQLVRVWPRSPLAVLDVETAADRVAENIRRQVDRLLLAGRSIVASLTAGLDSRVSLAATRQARRDITYFTYFRQENRVDRLDLRLAREIAAAMGISHESLEIPKDPDADGRATVRALGESSFLRHLPMAAEMYRRAFPPGSIHLRSNVSEIGRRFYDRSGKGVALAHATDMANVWKRMGDEVEAVAAFEEWSDAVAFWEVTEVDPLDLFYWEFRMPVWHGRLLLESDIAFDTYSLFNCREILATLLSVDEEARRNGTVYRAVIERLWPELLRWDFNTPQVTEGRPRRH